MKSIVENWRGYLKEGRSAGKGVQLEWAIVYWALKAVADPQILEERISKYPELLQYGEGPMKEDARSALQTARTAGAQGEVFHSQELGIRGAPEPKTDIKIGNHRVSVKMTGGIQLSSAEGKTTAKMLQTIFDEMMEEPEFSQNLEQEVLTEIIDRIKKTPTKMIDPKNLIKALKRKPAQALLMMKDKKLLGEHNWKIWEAQNKESIINEIVEFLNINPEFKYRLIEEALTGKRLFGIGDPATADYICTPTYYGPIDRTYIKKTMEVTKIQVRAKSRSGITSAAFRFDVADAAKTATLELEEEELTEAMAPSAMKEKLKEWWANFKNYMKAFFAKHIKRIISRAVLESKLDVTFS